MLDALTLTAEWLKRHVNFENTSEPYSSIIARAYMEIFNWDQNVIFPEVIFITNNYNILILIIINIFD